MQLCVWARSWLIFFVIQSAHLIPFVRCLFKSWLGICMNKAGYFCVVGRDSSAWNSDGVIDFWLGGGEFTTAFSTGRVGAHWNDRETEGRRRDTGRQRRLPCQSLRRWWRPLNLCAARRRSQPIVACGTYRPRRGSSPPQQATWSRGISSPILCIA